ncbi:hypothetical protein F4775DRAFT_553525 [Biscogniauxia sp. FL1348]|nr:hypothetical protein F4775DRAFT_553525 [Biscogniauxia sp. FL1348]
MASFHIPLLLRLLIPVLSHAAPSPFPFPADSIGDSGITDRRAEVAWHGFDESCASWHTEPSPDGVQILLVARCYDGGGTSDEHLVCSQLDLNNCLEPLPGDWNWLQELGPKKAPDDKKFFPHICSQAMIDTGPTSSTTSTETVMGTICNKIGEAGTIHGSVDIAPVVVNWSGYLVCVGITGTKSTLCR